MRERLCDSSADRQREAVRCVTLQRLKSVSTALAGACKARQAVCYIYPGSLETQQSILLKCDEPRLRHINWTLRLSKSDYYCNSFSAT